IVETYRNVIPDRGLTLTELDVTAVEENPATPAPPFSLAAPAPNPVRDEAAFRFGLPLAARVRLDLFDIRGRRVATALDAQLPAGRHEAVWRRTDARGRRVASGVYVARLEALGEVRIRKLVLVR
ncbi:MAG TPA: hypothetical protein VFM00_11035, partial [Candidatus Eisenbacteria bacterium]|nr:hypothetical protein [Candidatus Eisenbacteria bacterium]